MASFSSIPPDSKSVISDLTVDVMTRHTNQIRQKAVFVGDSGVGKTSIILRINENKFKDNYEVSKFIVINLYRLLLELIFLQKLLNFVGKILKYKYGILQDKKNIKV